jgi:hypothetical protein
MRSTCARTSNMVFMCLHLSLTTAQAGEDVIAERNRSRSRSTHCRDYERGPDCLHE